MGETLTERLARISLFAHLATGDLERIAEAARRRPIARDASIFEQGEEAQALYMVDAGQVRLTQLTPDGDQIILRFVEPGEVFGGVGVFGLETYPARAQAVRDGYVLAWDTETMRGLLLRLPQLALNFLAYTAAQIVQLQDRVRELQTERVERRLARALLRLARTNGKRVQAGVLIDLRLSRQDLAEMTGTNLYTVSRIMSAWEKKGLVEGGRERVVLNRPHELVVIAEDIPSPSTTPKNG